MSKALSDTGRPIFFSLCEWWENWWSRFTNIILMNLTLHLRSLHC